MVIFGIHRHPYRSILPPEFSCPNCREKGQTVFNQISRVFHIFYLPVLAFGHGHESLCNYCKLNLKSSEMDREFKTNNRAYLKSNIPPIWHFSGLLFMALFILSAKLYGMKKQNDIRERIVHLEEGRIFDYKTKLASYSTFKVAKIEGDSVELIYNLYDAGRKADLHLVKVDKNYAGERRKVHRDQLLQWFDKGTVFHVHW
ncbi:MAG: hypothetical protein R8P61_24795 [Bacteroidia bacterium]|nr:hypothetical protein [Bacteroidia bacterium]